MVEERHDLLGKYIVVKAFAKRSDGSLVRGYLRVYIM
jgi:hypothetical protein